MCTLLRIVVCFTFLLLPFSYGWGIHSIIKQNTSDLFPQPGQEFGRNFAVSPNGRFMAVSYDQTNMTNGHIMIFKSEKKRFDKWEYVQDIPDPAGSILDPSSLFAYSIALSDSVLAVGVPGDNVLSKVILYKYNDGTETWDLLYRIKLDDNNTGFGAQVAISDIPKDGHALWILQTGVPSLPFQQNETIVHFYRLSYFPNFTVAWRVNTSVSEFNASTVAVKRNTIISSIQLVDGSFFMAFTSHLNAVYGFFETDDQSPLLNQPIRHDNISFDGFGTSLSFSQNYLFISSPYENSIYCYELSYRSTLIRIPINDFDNLNLTFFGASIAASSQSKSTIFVSSITNSQPKIHLLNYSLLATRPTADILATFIIPPIPAAIDESNPQAIPPLSYIKSDDWENLLVGVPLDPYNQIQTSFFPVQTVGPLVPIGSIYSFCKDCIYASKKFVEFPEPYYNSTLFCDSIFGSSNQKFFCYLNEKNEAMVFLNEYGTGEVEFGTDRKLDFPFTNVKLYFKGNIYFSNSSVANFLFKTSLEILNGSQVFLAGNVTVKLTKDEYVFLSSKRGSPTITIITYPENNTSGSFGSVDAISLTDCFDMSETPTYSGGSLSLLLTGNENSCADGGGGADDGDSDSDLKIILPVVLIVSACCLMFIILGIALLYVLYKKKKTHKSYDSGVSL